MKPTTIFLLASCVALSAATEEQINKRLAAQTGDTLIVDVDFGSVDVRANAGNEVVADVFRKVTRLSKDDEEAYLRARPVTFSQDGNTITIHSRTKSKASGSSRGRQSTEGKYTITVPAQFNVRLNTS